MHVAFFCGKGEDRGVKAVPLLDGPLEEGDGVWVASSMLEVEQWAFLREAPFTELKISVGCQARVFSPSCLPVASTLMTKFCLLLFLQLVSLEGEEEGESPMVHKRRTVPYKIEPAISPLACNLGCHARWLQYK